MYKDLILFSIALFLWGIGETSFFSFLPIYLEKFGANPLQIGAIIGGFGLVGISVHLPAGYLADKFGRRQVLIVGWIIGFVSTLLMGIANSLPFFVFGLYLYFSTAFIMSPLQSYVSAAKGNFSIQRALTLVSTSFNLGAIFGPLIGGKIGEKIGFSPIFFFAAGTFLVSNVFIFFIRSQPVEKLSGGGKAVGLFKNIKYLQFLPVLSLVIFSLYLSQPLVPNYLQNFHHYDLYEIGRLFSVSSIGVVFFNLVLGQMEVRSGFILGQVMMVSMSAILWKFSGAGWFFIAFFLLGSFKPTRTMASAIVRSLVKSSHMGFAFGLAETASAAAIIVSPVFAGYLYEADPLLIFTVSTLLISVCIVLSLIYSASLRSYVNN